jgi:hypothetical protein
MSTCFRCGKEFDGMGVYVFTRSGLNFHRVPDILFCIACGSNAANVLTEEEEARLP